MDRQFIEELRDLWFEHGSDMEDWPEEGKRKAALAFYEADAREDGDCMADAITDMTASSLMRDKVLRGFKKYATDLNPLGGANDLAGCVIAALLNYPIGILITELDLRRQDFEQWKRENNLRLEADSLNDAAQ